jgi:hypothetical protein
MTVLVDHNMEGQAVLIWGNLAAEGWLELLPLRLVTLADIGLPLHSDDRTVWRYAQAHAMVLLTGNRRMRGVHSLEQTIREENTASALPVLTIGTVDRIDEREYRELCAQRLLEIMIGIDDYRGAGRIFIP